MSDLATDLLNNIRNEFDNRINEGKTPEQAVAFSKNIFITKYKYDPNTLDELLSELHEYGYIQKWITGDFALKID